MSEQTFFLRVFLAGGFPAPLHTCKFRPHPDVKITLAREGWQRVCEVGIRRCNMQHFVHQRVVSLSLPLPHVSPSPTGHHDPNEMNRDELYEYKHWWNNHKATPAETERVYRVARAENAELKNVRKQLTDCITAPKMRKRQRHGPNEVKEALNRSPREATGLGNDGFDGDTSTSRIVGGGTGDHRYGDAPNTVQGGDASSLQQLQAEVWAWKAATAALMGAVGYLMIPVYRIPVHGTLGSVLGLLVGATLGTVVHAILGTITGR